MLKPVVAERSPEKELESVQQRGSMRLTENQLKVIRDKYLRDAAGPEAWLWGVARNIAMAEILLHPQAQRWGIFDSVQRLIREIPTKQGETAKLILFHQGLYEARDRDANFVRLMKNLERAIAEVPGAAQLVEEWGGRFYEMLARFDFLPNSPTLMNAGRELQQLSACYVLPVEDSMEAITKALTAQSLIQKAGGGTGFSFGRLRPAGDVVKKTQGVASGAISFMQIYDKMTDVVKQGGCRRGANMGILPYWHPEIREFISMKSRPGVMENFNVSVAIDAKFMQAVKEGAEYDLINPRTQQPVGKANAPEIFNLMVECAWKTGDPGFVVLDHINNSGSNPMPLLGQVESTNPCGEVPLLPWEPCNLGSINLANFVEGSLLEGKLNYERLGETVSLAVRFLDDVIEVNNYPLPEIEEMAKGGRRIGAGIMGWAEALVRLGIPYDSPKALEMAEKVMAFIDRTALETSEELAKERGAFPYWKNSIYDEEGPYFRGEHRFPRHCARTTIAPTGTIAIAAGLQGGGIEPFFGIAYTRYNARALDALKKGDSPDPKDVFFEVNPLFKEVAEKNKFFGLGHEELWKKIDRNHKAVRGIPEVPRSIQDLFPVAHDVAVEFHVKIQAAFQRHTDNGVSKTINMPGTVTVEDVRRAYLLAYEEGCKGITIYRDGCKAQQVLNLSSQTGMAVPPQPVQRKPREGGPLGVSSQYYQIQTGYGPLHIHINYDDQGPYQVFTNLPPMGTEISGLTSLIGILLSKYFEYGGDPARILKHLNSVKGDRPLGFGENRINSIPHAIGVALRMHLKKMGLLDQDTESQPAESKRLELWEAVQILYCPNCYSSNVAFESGCSGPTCHDCGYSECS
ncbi:MAG: adenosylcobalamin-dependent ribonucleoside-diphosphate reductase [Elusimicrobia bacterium]|nr:adenosylcobalamin-dependent ribonucleoside-diphosphate reductase [Elusimicrobiota bacterium]